MVFVVDVFFFGAKIQKYGADEIHFFVQKLNSIFSEFSVKTNFWIFFWNFQFFEFFEFSIFRVSNFYEFSIYPYRSIYNQFLPFLPFCLVRLIEVFNFVSFSVPIENTRILEGQNCPLDGYCLNGGTCRYFQAIGELSCL